MGQLVRCDPRTRVDDLKDRNAALGSHQDAHPAARYCRPGDRASVLVRPEGRVAVLEVVDSGPGIAADELPHVFERLWRGRSARQVAGSGIGLAVAREIVTAHGGTIEATSREGAGTTITIRLPRSPASLRE